MPQLRALGAVAVVAAASVMVVTPAAWADDAKSVQVASQDGRDLNFLVYLDPQVLPEANADVTSKVVISGVEIPSEATPVLESKSAKEAILVLDESGSMRGPRLAAAKEAATSFVKSLPDDVEIGVVSFNDAVTVDIAPTTDKKAVIAAIDGLKAGQKTALYDGMIQGLDFASADKGARLLVLSDGGDTVSSAAVDDVKAAADQRGIPIDIVALSPTTQHAALLRDVATPTGGQFILAADATGLQQAFTEATGSFGGKIKVTSQVPPEVDASGRFAIVTVGIDGTDFTGTTQLPRTEELAGTGSVTPIPVPSAGQATGDSSASGTATGSRDAWLYAILVALIVIVAALAIASYRRQLRSRLRTEQVLWYSNVATTGAVTSRRPEYTQQSLLDSLDEWMSTKSFYPGIDTKLDNAGLQMNVATWIAIRVIATLSLAVLVGVLLGNALIGLVVGGLIGWLVSGMWLNSREAARRKDFEEELPDFLMLIASSLRSGLSFQQAIDSTAAEGKGEVSRQMRRAMSEVQMGATIEQALTRAADRMHSEDLKWAVTALTIQREVGGNLSNILDAAAQTIKAREELRREVKTLSAEGRLSGWVLAALPVGLFLYMLFANRSYVSFFWTYTVGWIALGSLLILFIVGFIWMRRLVKIEV